MKKSITVAPKKKRGRPSTGGRDPHIAARMPAELIAEIEAWAVQNDTSRSDAFRRLVEIGLSKSKTLKKPKVLSTAKEGAARAAELAAGSDKP